MLKNLVNTEILSMSNLENITGGRKDIVIEDQIMYRNEIVIEDHVM